MVVIAFLPSLGGCLWSGLLKGNLDFEAEVPVKELDPIGDREVTDLDPIE